MNIGRFGWAGMLLVTTALTAPATLLAAEGATGEQLAQVETRRFDIAPQPLASALTEFGRQSGLQVSYPSHLAEGLTSPGIAGTLTAEGALARLLSGTGMTWRFSGTSTVILDKVAASGAMSLDPVTVEGTGPVAADDSARGPTQGYLAKVSASGTKTATPVAETPQSISVVTREQIEDQGSRTVMQAMRYTPGAFTGQVGASNRYDYVILRGLTDRSIENVYLDGLKVLGDDWTYSSLQVDPYTLERIDAVKGPSSVLYGRSSPGGLIDLTSKKPLFEPSREMQVTYGSRNQRGIGFDVTGPVNEGKSVAYRVVGTAHASDTQFDHTKEERYTIAPSVTAKGEDTTLTLMAYLQKDPEGGTHNGSPAEGSLYPHDGRYVSRHFFDGEPGWEQYERTQKMVGYQLEHRFDDTWTARQNLRYLDAGVDIDQIYQTGWVAGTDTLNRSYGGGHESLSGVVVDNQLQADFATGALRHTVLGGLDYQSRKSKNDWMFIGVSGIDGFNPVYGQYTTLGTPFLMKNTRHLEQTGVYVQDQLALDRWRLSLGLRQDWASASNLNRIADTEVGEQRRKLTKRAGLLYLFDNGVAPYVSYAESFNPSIAVDALGRMLKPTEGTQYEAGVKYQPPGSRSMVTAALFTIDQKNLAVTDPINFVTSPAGTIRSRGVELEGNLQVSDSLKLMAGYSFTEAKYTESPYGYEGNYATQVPRHMASLWADYTVPGGDLLRFLTVGGGVRFVGETWADRANTRKVPTYTVADLSLRYDLEAVGAQGADFRLNVTNLFDSTYLASCYELSNCYWGEERTITGTLTYKF